MTEDSTGPTNSSAEGLGTYLPGTASLVQEIDSEWQLYMNIIYINTVQSEYWLF